MTDEELMEYGRRYLKIQEYRRRWIADHRATKPKRWCQEVCCRRAAVPGRRKCARHLARAAERTREARARKQDQEARP